MYRIIRFLAVIAIALSPVWGVQTAAEARGSAYPVWPAYGSSGCQSFTQGGITCGTNGFILTQLTSGYACNQLDVNVSSFTSGPFILTATTQSGSNNQTISIDDAGDWFIQFPYFLTNNLITVQVTAPNGGVMVFNLSTSTCPVASPTATDNPSDTATSTPVPVTGTPTPIPTFTPLPSGHNTFTRTPTPAPGTSTATGTATATPGPTERNCGDVTFPLLNCDFSPGTFAVDPDHWANGRNSGTFALCYNPSAGLDDVFMNFGSAPNPFTLCQQTVVAHATGDVYLRYQYTQVQNVDPVWADVSGTHTSSFVHGPCFYGSGNFCDVDITSVTSGTSYTFSLAMINGGHQTVAHVYIDKMWVQTSGNPTPSTPIPATDTSTPTPVPGTSTPTLTPSLTPVGIPGAMSTNIPTATECPGGCAVAALTEIPGVSTRITVDTSPFSALTHLSLARSSCVPFGYVQIPYPVIHGTPALGSTTPMSVTWTTELTHTWDDTHLITNTAIQPCAMANEIPTTFWDFTYWGSGFGIFVVFTMWLIGFVGRLSGGETING